MNFISRLLFHGSKRAYRSFVRDTKRPEDATLRLWGEIWREVGGSKHWMEHGRALSSLEDFPLTVYGDYRSSIEESYQSGQSLLARSKIVCWGQSSGTTTKIPKVYPVTSTYQRQMDAVNHAYTHAFLREFPNHTFGKALFFVASALEQSPQDKIERAYMSHYGIKKMPKMVFNRSSVVPRSIYLSSAGEFNEWAPLYALAGRIDFTQMILPGILHAFWDRIQTSIDGYWPYLEGRKRLPTPLPQLHCSASRLGHLKGVFNRSERTISDVWPDLKTVFSWRSGISQVQEQELRSVLGNVPIYNLPYCATEGYFTVPVEGESTGGVVHPGANILEFLPVDCEAQASALLKPWQLEEGKRYELVLTSSMGLIRYRMLDIVECTGFFNRSPIIEFACKSAHVMRLNRTNIFEANLAAALTVSGFRSERRWVFGPNCAGSALMLYVRRPSDAGADWEQSEEIEALRVLLGRVDIALQDVNISYANERKISDVKPPDIVFLPHDHDVWIKDDMLTTKPRLLMSTSLKAPG